MYLAFYNSRTNSNFVHLADKNKHLENHFKVANVKLDEVQKVISRCLDMKYLYVTRIF